MQPCLSETSVALGEWRKLRQEVRHAAQLGGFSLAYLPRVSLIDGTVCAYEVQLRWKRRRGGLTASGTFMPLLEETGLAGEVLSRMVTEACRAAMRAGVAVCVSLPAFVLRPEALLPLVGAALSGSDLPPERLELGFAEGALAGAGEDTGLLLAALRDTGVGVALDEFGSTSAGLMPLRCLPLSTLKLDRSLVRELPGDEDATAIVRATAGLAQRMGLTLVGNGVDAACQAARLRELGADAFGGALAGAPVAALAR